MAAGDGWKAEAKQTFPLHAGGSHTHHVASVDQLLAGRVSLGPALPYLNPLDGWTPHTWPDRPGAWYGSLAGDD